ncbi:hypothetical protein FZW96_07300 [Bacillus sp. BGMRC 2118]|nr:hypothetical protein FZW96_07300 [Bacillus sp. BGMRC 2118]
MRKWKIIGSLLLVFIVCGAGSFYYFTEVKEYNVEDPELDSIASSEYKIDLPLDEETVEEAMEAVQAETEATSDETSVVQSSEEKSTDKNTSQSTQPKKTKKMGESASQTTKITVESILAKYEPAFESLEAQANSKLDSLVNTAAGEYKEKKNNKEEISYWYFYNKYSAAASRMEANTDEAFTIVYNALVSELKENGYKASQADSFKSKYEQTKKAQRKSILDKALAQLN